MELTRFHLSLDAKAERAVKALESIAKSLETLAKCVHDDTWLRIRDSAHFTVDQVKEMKGDNT